MTVRVEREFTIDASCAAIWEFIADPGHRAEAISVVAGYSIPDGAGNRATWDIKLPIPILNRTIRVETRDLEREPPTYVKFVGRSRVLRVLGEHRLERTADGCVVSNKFVVDGSVPGVERFFKRNFESEIDNIEAGLRQYLADREPETD